jgi:hypothetical protein
MFSQVHELAAVLAVGGSVPMTGSGGVIEWITNTVADLKALVGSVLVLAGIVAGLIIGFSKRNVPGVIMAVIVGALIAGLGVIIVSTSSMFQHDFSSSSSASGSETVVVQVVEPVEGAGGPM